MKKTIASNLEIIKTAIPKALANGWDPEFKAPSPIEGQPMRVMKLSEVDNILLRQKYVDMIIGSFVADPKCLFDHKFAKAMFGEDPTRFSIDLGRFPKDFDEKKFIEAFKEPGPLIFDENKDVKIKIKQKSFHYHLQQMVIRENPADYLIEYLAE